MKQLCNSFDQYETWSEYKKKSKRSSRTQIHYEEIQSRELGNGVKGALQCSTALLLSAGENNNKSFEALYWNEYTLNFYSITACVCCATCFSNKQLFEV